MTSSEVDSLRSPEHVAGPAGTAAHRAMDAVFAHCPSPVIRTDGNGIMAFLNPAALQMHDVAPEDVIGRHIAILAPEDMQAYIGELIAHVRNGGSFVDLPFVATARDGSLLSGKLSVFGTPDETGQVVDIYGMITDVGRQSETPPADAASEPRFREAFDDGRAARFMIDLHGQIMKVNTAACRLLGYREDALCRLDVSHIWQPDGAGSSALTQLHALSGSPTRSLPMRLAPQHGAILWARVTVSLLSDASGKPLFMLVTAMDLSPGALADEHPAASQARLHEILDRLDYAYLELNQQWDVIKVNNAALAIGGFTPDIVGQRLQDILPPADFAALADQLQRVLLDHELELFDEYYYAPANRWLSVRAAPTDGGIGLFLRDVSQRRQLKEDLGLARLRFQSLADNVPAAIFLIEINDDPPHDDAVLYLSPYFEVITGYPVPAQGLSYQSAQWMSLLHPDDREQVLTGFKASLLVSDQCTLEFRLARADGRYIRVQSITVTMRDAANVPVGRIGILTDITARWEAEQANIRLEAIVASADEAIYSLTPEGRITSWNASAERITGYAPAMVFAKTFAELFPEDALPPFDLAAVQASPGGLRTAARLHRRDGQIADLTISEAIMHSADGTLIGVSGVAQDVTALRAAERVLRDALHTAEAGERSKTFFLSMMSHELRTPLQSVLGYAELLLSGGSGEITATQAEDIIAIARGAARMSSLLTRILDLSRLFGNQLELTSEAVDLAAICQDVARAFQAEAEARGLTITLTLQPGLPPVQGDAQRLRQILHNLVENAVKFTEQGGVRITLRRRGAWLEAVVEDSGIGISRQDLPHIFEVFQQVDSRLSRRYEGAGLGLPLAQHLARLMGGDVTAASVPGKSSSFTLRLPA